MMEDDEEFETCEWCGGKFVPEDMDGEHCIDCAVALFEDDQP